MFALQKTSTPAIEQRVRQDYQSLSEKDRRRFAAVEALTLGQGGIRSIANVLGGDPHPVKEGMREIEHLPADPAEHRVRNGGGGRNKTAAKHPDVIEQVHNALKDRTAGDPMRQDVRWTDATPQELADRLHAHAVCGGPRIVRRMLERLGFARRQMATGWPGGDAPHRREPFHPLAHLLQAFLDAGNPVLRIETKKKAYVGTLSRAGQVSCREALQACDHACPRRASGVIMPHGIDDLARHQGWMPRGRSRATTPCACESLRVLWRHDGQRLSPHASAILLLCDGGGRNSGHKPVCKEDLQGVVNDLAVPIRVAHSPASCAKGNPIERRLFRHVTRACQGGLFDALHTVKGLIQKTTTPQGLPVTVRVLDTRYAGGRTVSDALKKHMPIVFEKLLPKWNYWALPQSI